MATRWASATLNAGCKKAFSKLLSGEIEGPYLCRQFVRDFLSKEIEKNEMETKLSKLGIFDTEGRDFIE